MRAGGLTPDNVEEAVVRAPAPGGGRELRGRSEARNQGPAQVEAFIRSVRGCNGGREDRDGGIERRRKAGSDLTGAGTFPRP